jgi:drug/metabolite transporter (DMT)-like permease
VGRRDWILLGALAALWGASYLFIKIGLDDLPPAWIVFLRTALAALVVLPLALRRDALRGLRPVLGPLALLALVQVAAPFMLITVGEEEIASSLAGILVASAPIFTALLAVWVDHEERSHGWRLVGVLAGIVGVALLLGVDVGGDSAALAGALMVLLASLGYAIGGFYLKRRFAEVQPIGVVTGTMSMSALMLLPWVLLELPAASPGLGPLAAVAALGVLGTGIAFVIFYTLIATVGPAKASIVAYVAPVFSIFYGVALLDEPFTAGTAGGVLLILAGSWLAAGALAPRARVATAPEPCAEDALSARRAA